MSANYALNNFNKAFSVLANQGSGKRRWLCGKYVEHLCHLDDSDMPDALKERFIQFKHDMETVRESCKAEDFRHAVHVMDDAQVIEIAARILSMHEVLVHETSVELLARKTGGWSTPFHGSPCSHISPKSPEGVAFTASVPRSP